MLVLDTKNTTEKDVMIFDRDMNLIDTLAEQNQR